MNCINVKKDAGTNVFLFLLEMLFQQAIATIYNGYHHYSGTIRVLISIKSPANGMFVHKFFQGNN